MDKLKSMQVFIDIVELGSLTKAAERNRISSTMAGKHLKALETGVKQTLLNRTTRKLSLTEAGKLYYHSCKQVKQTLHETENQLQLIQQRPSGKIHINAPVTFSEQILAPMLPKFIAQYPDIELALTCNNHVVDAMTSDADLFIRIGELKDSDLFAQYLGKYQMIYAASPEYLQYNSVPKHTSELSTHQCLGFIFNQPRPETFKSQNMPIRSNSGQVLLQAAIAGCGIILQPQLLLTGALATGKLHQILKNESPTPKSIHLLYRNKPLPLKLKVLIDFIKANYIDEACDM